MRIGGDLRTDGLDRVLEHEAGDLTCTVEAGLRLSASEPLWRSTANGSRSTRPATRRSAPASPRNLSGPLRHRFGAPRDLVLGVTLVLADGTVANAGGKVVKNVAGYDLGKLVCGSQGTLALIARVSLRLHPVPAAARTLVVETDDAAAVVRRSAALTAAAERARRAPPRAGGRALRGWHGRGRGPAATRDRAGRRRGDATKASGQRHAGDRARAAGRVRFDPGRLGEVLTGLDEAIVRPAAGVAYVPHETEDDTPAAVHALNERDPRAVRSRLDPLAVMKSGREPGGATGRGS